MNIGEKIKKAREEKGLSQRRLGMIAGVNYSELSKIEAGDRKCPTLKTLKKICRYIDLNYYDLLYDLGLGCSINPKNQFLVDYYNNLDFNSVKEVYKIYKFRYEMALSELQYLYKQFDSCKSKEETNLLIDTIKMLEYDNTMNKFIIDLLNERIINRFLENG